MDESLVSSEKLYSGRIVELTLDRIETSCGVVADREVVIHGGSVAIVAQGSDEQIALVRQYRHPIRQVTLELPAGTREKDEEALSCAVRELREETGYRAIRIERIAGFYAAPGYCTEYLDIFWATDLVLDPLDKDPDEEITVEWLTLGECLDAIDRCDMSDAKTIIGILALTRKLGR